jgi:hypothetical protein
LQENQSPGPVLEKRRSGLEKRLQYLARLVGERCFVERAGHQLEPAIARRLTDGEGRMADAQPGMTALFNVGLRTAETKDEEIAEPLPRSFQILRRVHRPENVVARDLSIKRVDKALESVLTDGGINVLLFHSNRS